jgi:type IV pilus assembly protein PilO
LLQLIQGSGELTTFLAQLDREATRLGVQLELYEPVVAPPPVAEAEAKTTAKKDNQPPPPPQSPLEAAGLKAQKILLTAKAPYPNLLAFLRATEKLSYLVSQSNLSLSAVELPKLAPSSPAPAGAPAPVIAPVGAQTELKLMLTLYQSPENGLAPNSPKKP